MRRGLRLLRGPGGPRPRVPGLGLARPPTGPPPPRRLATAAVAARRADPEPWLAERAPAVAFLQGTDVSAKVRLWATTDCHRELSGLLQALRQAGEDPAPYAAELLRDPAVPRLRPRIAALLLLHGEGPPDAPTDSSLLDLLVEKLRRDGAGMGQQLLAEAITRYSLLGLGGRVAALAEEYVAGQRPAVDVYTALLRHYQRVGDTQQVLAVIQGVHEHLNTDIIWFRTVLRTLLDMGAYAAMPAVQAKMEADRVEGDSLVLQLLLQGLVARGQPWSDVEALWGAMVDRGFVRPGPRVFHVLLNAAWQANGQAGVEDVLRRLEFLAVPVDGAIITFLVQAGLMAEARARWQAYRASAAATRAKALSLRRLQEAFRAADRPDLAAEVAQLRGELVCQDGASLYDGLRDLLRRGTPEAVTQALQLWEQVGPRELQANPKLYVAGVEVLGAAGNLKKVAQLADSAPSWTTDLVNALLAVYCAKRRFPPIIGLLQKAYQNRLRPNAQTQQLLHTLFTSIRPQLHRLVFGDRGLFLWFFAEDQLRMACLHDVAPVVPRLMARMRQFDISVLTAVRSMLRTETESRCFVQPRCARLLAAGCAAEVAAAPAVSAADVVAVADELLARALEDAEGLPPAETEELLRHFLSLYQRSGEPGRIWDVLQAFRPVMATAPQETATLVALAHAYAATRQWEELQALEEMVAASGRSVPVDWFAALFEAYGAADPERLRPLWRAMVVEHRVMPDDRITALFDHHHGSRGYSWAVAETQSRDPDVCVALLRALLAARQRGLALQLWGRMHYDGVLQSPEFGGPLWSTLLAAAAEAGHTELFGEAERCMSDRGLLGSDDYRLLFRKYGQDPAKLRKLYAAIRGGRVELDAAAHLDLLRLLLAPQAPQAPPSTRDPPFALTVLKEVRARRVPLDVAALAGLLSDASASGQEALIAPLWACIREQVEAQHVALTLDVARACAVVFQRHGLPALAVELQASLAAAGTRPNTFLLNLLLTVYLNHRLLPEAEAVVRLMEQHQLPPNQRTFQLLFRLYSHDRAADRSLQLWQQVRLTPCTAEVYHAAVLAFTRRKTPQVLREVRQAMDAHGVRPTRDLAHALLEAWLEAGHLTQCQEVLDWMAAEGLPANDRTVRRLQETRERSDELLALCLDVARQLADADPNAPPPNVWPDPPSQGDRSDHAALS